MKHIFITSLHQPVESWIKAFPELLSGQATVSVPVSEAHIVWVHAQMEEGASWQSQLQQLLSRVPALRVIVLSNNPEQAEAMQALALGAVGYLHAYSHQQVLKEVYNVIMNGGVWLGRDLLKYMIGKTAEATQRNHQQREEILDALTRREREVALEAAKGLSNKEIARSLAISERTVKAHLTSVFDTLQVKDRLHLALILQGQQPSAGNFFLDNRPTSASDHAKILHS